MKTSKQMQHVILQLCERHGVDLNHPEAALSLENAPYQPLYIYRLGACVYVRHSFIQNGDEMFDPSMVFFTGYDEWVPVEIIQHPMGVHRVVAEIEKGEITKVNLQGIAELATFANQWARNLKAQGWLAGSTVKGKSGTRPPDPPPGPDPKVAAQLRKAGDTLQDKIDHCLADRLTNTPRRVREAERMEEEGRRLQKLQGVLYALAAHWNAGTVPALLGGLKTKAVIDYVLTYGGVPQYESSEAERKRLAAAGVHDDQDYQAVKAALLALLEPGTGDKTPEQHLRDLERDLVGLKIPGFFPTPPDLVAHMIARADLEPGLTVLEPSAGAGHIADRVLSAYTDEHGTSQVQVDCIEISPRLREILTAKGHTVIGHDFLEEQPRPAYDRVIMNPPFEQLADIDHVRHAVQFLKPGGRLVAIMSESPFFRKDKKAEAFREWLSAIGFDEPLPEDAFKASDRPTGVRTRLVVIDTPVAANVTPEPEAVPVIHLQVPEPVAAAAPALDRLPVRGGTKDNPALYIPLDTGVDFSFNLIKARAILQHIEAIRQFVEGA